MSDESDAIKEVAVTAGKITEASREMGGFIAKLIQGPLEQGIGIFEDKLRYIRWERQVRLRTKYKELMREIGMTQPTRTLPLNFAIPFFRGASLEEDDIAFVRGGLDNSPKKVKRLLCRITQSLM